MTKPVRLQLSRRKGFLLQEQSRAINGLEAVNCARPGKWGNRYCVGVDGTAEECGARFRADWESGLLHPLGRVILQERLAGLRGKNLACWCSLPKPGHPDICHCDILLALANK